MPSPRSNGSGEGPRPAVRTDLQQVCRAAVDALDLNGAVISLMVEATDGGVGAEAIAASWGAAAREIEELQLSVGEGPSRDAFVGGRPVLVPDLEQRFDRWPAYSIAAASADVGAAFAFPLVVGAIRLGVLTLYSTDPRELTADDVADCLMLRELAVQCLLEVDADPGQPDGTALTGRLHFRDEVYQAQGIVTVTLGLNLTDALARMRAHAFATGQDLNDLATDLVAGRQRLTESGDEP